MRLLARFAYILTLGEVDLMPVVTEWLGAVLEELDFQNEAKNQSLGWAEAFFERNRPFSAPFQGCVAEMN